MFRDIMAEVLEEFVEAATLGGHSLADEEIDAALYHRLRNREYVREHRARMPRVTSYAQRECKWCHLVFTVVCHARPGRVREYCCAGHQNAAKQWRHRNNA